MARSWTSINMKDKKWTVTISWGSMFGGGKRVAEYDTFKEAYASVAGQEDDISIDWHPDWMQMDIDAVNKAVEEAKQKEVERKELEQLDKLQKKYKI